MNDAGVDQVKKDWIDWIVYISRRVGTGFFILIP